MDYILVMSGILLYMIFGATIGYLFNEYRVKAGKGMDPEDDYSVLMFLGVVFTPMILAFFCAVMIAGKFKIVINKN